VKIGYHLPGAAIIVRAGEIPDMIYISKGVPFGEEVRNTGEFESNCSEYVTY
jgi:hypothetical protein